jgi:beta-lactamase class A
MIAILKKVDRGEIKLDDNLTITEEDLDSLYGTVYQKGAGAKMTVWELLKEMILSSDNTAKNVLKEQMSQAELNAVFVHVGIENPYIKGTEVTVSSRDYMRLFKALYFSTFLSPELSEKALDLATDTEEEDLLSKGVSSEIQVSHKFGVYYNELHDCGIVYHPKNPYFICIMTGDIGNISNNEELITKISKDTYNFVDNHSSDN